MSKLFTIEEAIPSDTFQFGGEPLNQIIMILTGASLDSEEEIKLNTTFRFYSGKFAIYENDPVDISLRKKVFFQVENIDTSGDKTITIRNPTVANDFLATEQQNQVFQNKTFSTNTQFSADVDANSNSLIKTKSLTLVTFPSTEPVATATEVPLYRKDIDANNQGIYISKLENGVPIKVRVT